MTENTNAKTRARNLVAHRVAEVCGPMASDREVDAVITKFGYDLDGVMGADIYEVAVNA